MVVISTANGLKFTDFKIGYHEERLAGIRSHHANRPLVLPNDYDAVVRAIDHGARSTPDDVASLDDVMQPQGHGGRPGRAHRERFGMRWDEPRRLGHPHIPKTISLCVPCVSVAPCG